MYFHSNIRLLRKRRNKTQDELAQILKMKRSTLSGYENQVADPGIEVLLSFSRYFNMAVDTLLTVDLQKLSGSQLHQLEHGDDVFLKGGNLRILASTVDNSNNENIELVNEKASAGYTNGFSDPEYISDLPVFKLPFLSGSRKYRTFQLKGDSMLPIPDKAYVTGEFVTDWNGIVTGEAYVVLTLNDGIVFKIVENKIRDEGLLTLYSLNPLYEPFDVKVTNVREMWKFVNFISQELPEPVLPGNQLVKTVAGLQQEMQKLKKQLK
ncbi:MAG: LexA family transcriptional regulator [Bacteroidales bacterium]|nr:LexA family transcriptional regulator [Bacteroidales bacterium]